LLNNGDEKQNGADLKTINMSWCRLMVHFCFDGAPAILMTRELISIYFDHFDLFQSVRDLFVDCIPAGAIPAIPLSGPLFHPLVRPHCGQRDQLGVKQRFLIKESKSTPVSDTPSCMVNTNTICIATWCAHQTNSFSKLSTHK
jgi:hypothetical protein